MLNLHELESRWLRYKIKSYVPYIVIFLSIVVIIFALLYFLNANSSKVQQSGEVQTQKKIEPQIVLNVEKEKNTTKTTLNTKSKPLVEQQTQRIEKVDRVESSRVITPSMDFLHTMQNEPKIESRQFQEIEEEQFLERPVTKKTHNIAYNEIAVKEETYEQVEERETNDYEVSPPQKINIQRKSAYEDISDVIRRFKKNNNPALSLFIAKKYYELGDYRNAYNYALITNEINREIESSWIIFAKSLVKIGKKNMAIQTLQEYVKESHSDTARILLDEIRSGKFQ